MFLSLGGVVGGAKFLGKGCCGTRGSSGFSHYSWEAWTTKQAVISHSLFLAFRANGFWKHAMEAWTDNKETAKGGRSVVDSRTGVLCHACHAAPAIVNCRRN